MSRDISMTLTAMLLAGGQSRRMGTDKAIFNIGGEPLWRRQLRVLSELQPADIWISARTRPTWCPSELEVVLDEQPSRGPLSGLAAGLNKLQTTHLIVLAIDLPNASSDHLRKLSHLAKPGRGVIPQNAEHFEPLCAIYPVEAASIACDALASDDFALQQLAEALVRQGRAEKYPISVEERPLYHNLNRPSDLANESMDGRGSLS